MESNGEILITNTHSPMLFSKDSKEKQATDRNKTLNKSKEAKKE